MDIAINATLMPMDVTRFGRDEIPPISPILSISPFATVSPVSPPSQGGSSKTACLDPDSLLSPGVPTSTQDGASSSRPSVLFAMLPTEVIEL
jgi:hypothetical protein